MGIATAGAATGGALLRPSAVGAIMRVRSCMLGLGAHDYSEEKERTSAEAVASVWRGGETYGEEGRKLGKRAASALKAMRLQIKDKDFFLRLTEKLQTSCLRPTSRAPLGAWSAPGRPHTARSSLVAGKGQAGPGYGRVRSPVPAKRGAHPR